MRATTVRFSEDLWDLLEREAARQGISAAQFVRDASILRAAFLIGKRGDPEAEATIEQIARGKREEERPQGERELLAAIRAPRRLEALRKTALLDTPPDDRFDRLTRLAAKALKAPVALVSLIDEDRQYFKSCLGLPEPWGSARETPLTHSFCQHAVASRGALVVSDARKHPVLHDNLAIRDLGVVAYLGVPLITSEGEGLGTLCVIDHEPRDWTEDEVATVRDLAATVMTEIELRSAVGHLGEYADGET
ncbi:MAG: GAF domain-containing protein [Actinomycetota bacterium]|nr:GAF domain-containing protein [Actinomycetota bacterium]